MQLCLIAIRVFDDLSDKNLKACPRFNDQNKPYLVIKKKSIVKNENLRRSELIINTKQKQVQLRGEKTINETLASWWRAFSLSSGSQMSSTNCSTGESLGSLLEEEALEEAKEGGRLAIAFTRFPRAARESLLSWKWNEGGPPFIYITPGACFSRASLSPLRFYVVCLFCSIWRYGFCFKSKSFHQLGWVFGLYGSNDH